jgi:anti-anti-sigma factor
MADNPLRDEGGAEGTPFAVCVVTQAGRVDVSVTGDVDLTTREAFERVLDTACALDPHVRLDLRGVGFLDPHGASLLARRQAANPHLHVTHTSAAVRRIIEILSQIDTSGSNPPLLLDDSACDAVTP